MKSLVEKHHSECLRNKQLVIKDQYAVDCSTNFHHYNATAYKSFYDKKKAKKHDVKVANFNLWHPGQRKSIYKDYRIVAQIINQWDVVSALELQAVIAHDEEINQDVIQALSEGQDVAQLYREPGYLKILDELRKLDPSWALLLTPVAEAFQESSVHELTGFYYRAKQVRPFINRYCKEFMAQPERYSFACLPNFDGKFLDRPLSQIFSRRPFIANFESGNFDFTLVASHIVYNSPRDTETKQMILQNAFGVSSIKDLPVRVSKSKYARFAEVSATLEFINKLKQSYGEKDVIYAGDMNLEHDERLWPHLLNRGHHELLIKDKTTLTFRRYDRDGVDTNGVTSNYDHFIVNRENSQECMNQSRNFRASPFSFIQDKNISRKIERKYKIRLESKNEDGSYRMSTYRKLKAKALERSFARTFSSLKTVKDGEIVDDTYKREKTIEDFKRRVLDDQLNDKTYYRLYHEVVSDHLPVVLKCKTSAGDDDRRL